MKTIATIGLLGSIVCFFSVEAREKCGFQEGRINFWNRTDDYIDDFLADIRLKPYLTNKAWKSCSDAEGPIGVNHNRYTKITSGSTACYINLVRVNGIHADISAVKNDVYQNNLPEVCLAIDNIPGGKYKISTISCKELYGDRYAKEACN